MTDLVDSLCNWDLISCAPNCRRPLRRWRWRAPRIWTCSGCRTRWTVEGRRWAEVMSPSQLRRLARSLGQPDTEE